MACHTLVIRRVETSDWQAIHHYLAAVRNQAQLGPGELDRGLALADLCREGLRQLQTLPDGTLRFTHRDGRVVLRSLTPLDPVPDERPRGRCCAR